jgi:hypothetical protein
MMRYVWHGLGVAALVLGLSGVAAAQAPPGVQVIKTGDGKNLSVIGNSGNGVGNSIVIQGDGSGGTTILNGYPNGVGNKIIIDGKNIINQPGLIDNNWTIPEDIKALLEQDPCKWIPEGVRPALTPGFVNPWVPDCKAVPGQTNAVYKGKANPFYQFAVFNPQLNCQLYWDARTLTFFRYVEAEDVYRPVDWTAAALTPPVRPMPAVIED